MNLHRTRPPLLLIKPRDGGGRSRPLPGLRPLGCHPSAAWARSPGVPLEQARRRCPAMAGGVAKSQVVLA